MDCLKGFVLARYNIDSIMSIHLDVETLLSFDQTIVESRNKASMFAFVDPKAQAVELISIEDR
jgi:hypothetical protein